MLLTWNLGKMLINYPIQLNVELTTNCNSKCLDCNRYIRGTTIINPNIDIGKKGLITIDAIKNLIADPELIRGICLTGTYGDAPWHPKFFEILNLFPDGIQLSMETNGGMKDQQFWSDLGKLMRLKFAKGSHIIFGLDGIDNESHQKYRRTVDFNKVIENAKALMGEGIKARWSMIEFPHNSHLIETAKKMSEQLGFAKFQIRRSRLRHRILSKGDMTNQILDTGEYELTNNQKEKINKLMNIGLSPFRLDTEEKYKYFNTTEIKCEWANKRMASVDYTSRVWMCCNYSTFYHAQPGYAGEKLTSEEIRDKENLSWYEKKYSKNWNLLTHFTLKNILNHKFFTDDLPKSFNNDLKAKQFPRIERCAKHCGAMSRKIDSALKI